MINRLLDSRLHEAVLQVFRDAELSAIQVRPSADAKFGDYQCIAFMGLAKQLRKNPRQIASDVVARLKVEDLCETVTVDGPGFVNFKLRSEAVSAELSRALRGEHNFFFKTSQPRTVVIDFSSPNVAKPMHVGHIRSTILGDSLARLFRLLGHNVVTDNHIGDWGTQFGMLLIGWKQHLDAAALETDPIAELERIYKLINERCGDNPEVLEEARAELVKLQAGDEENLSIWKRMIALSQKQFDDIYGRLGVQFDETLGESYYNERLARVVEELVAKGIARESEGAIGVFSDGSSTEKKNDPFLVHRDGEWTDNPALIRKRDGGFNYATTDLATLAHRLETWNPQEIVYVTDGRQQLHFRQLFTAFQRWHPEARIRLAHVWFGSILGSDGKPFKTRSGETVKLAELLNEAEDRARKIVEEKNPDLPETQKAEIARVVGLGAIKYADLLPHRQSDYVFDWDRMLSLQGNTAPYLQYAYTRIRSIFRKSIDEGIEYHAATAKLIVGEGPEIALSKRLLEFGIVLEQVADDYRPNLLCNYLYELAVLFSRFFENCPVIKAEPAVRESRLALCDLTSRVLKQGLEILGIETVEVM